jgi:hypothetical protein
MGMMEVRHCLDALALDERRHLGKERDVQNGDLVNIYDLKRRQHYRRPGNVGVGARMHFIYRVSAKAESGVHWQRLASRCTTSLSTASI